MLATILFSDIVGSTARAAELGDTRWRQLLAEHHARVRHAASPVPRRGARHGRGRVLRPVRRSGPRDPLRGSDPGRAARLGLEVRLGLHTGECEALDGKVAGIAVSIGARVSALAAAGEVLVSQTVKDLVVGSGIAFEDRGVEQLKGVPGEWRLYSVASI